MSRSSLGPFSSPTRKIKSLSKSFASLFSMSSRDDNSEDEDEITVSPITLLAYYAKKCSTFVYALYKEPYTAFYRIYEHAVKRVSTIVKLKKNLKEKRITVVECGMHDLSAVKKEMLQLKERKIDIGAFDNLIYLTESCMDLI